jgi:hypothetical protein
MHVDHFSGREEPVDSANAKANFWSSVCNALQKCKTVKWYQNTVVDPGAVLDYGKSNTSFGQIAF